MCGIVGIFAPTQGRVPQRDILERMNQTQFHRGPDEGDTHLEPGIGLGHRRLSIIDLSSGRQPLCNEDGSVWVVYNGEIYNFAALRAELEAVGHVFRTHTDTEVIAHGWEEWGEDCVQHFRGMFAFAVWDRNRGQLFVARDRLGVKPLYYAWLADGSFIFGSELKALLAHPGLVRELDPCAVEEYFAYGYVPEPRTILNNVYKLEPAHRLTLQRGERARPQPRQYWELPFTDVGVHRLEQAAPELIERFREAVDIRLVADVPLGAFLSGGVDSSAVVAMMAGLRDEPVKTCSISFDDPNYDEAAYAAEVAARYHTDHQVELQRADDFSLIDRLATLYDEPFADSSAMPTYRVCEAARKRVKVALSGDGGDEHMAGYRRYRMHLHEQRLRDLLPAGLRRPLFGLLGNLYPKADWAPRPLRAKSTFQSLARDAVDGFFHSVSRMTDEHRAALYSDRFKAELQGYDASEVLHRHARNAPTDHPLSLVQYLDIKTFMVGVLHKVDRASMAHGLEVRCPLLDHELVSWISGLPPDLKLHGGEGKYVFKKALEPYLPNEIMYRPKMGFSIPMASWFRGPLRQKVRDAVLGEQLLDSGLFQRDTLARLVSQHESGRRDNSTMLWELLMFAAFQQQVMSA